MTSRFLTLLAVCACFLGMSQVSRAQQRQQSQTELSTVQRLDVLTSKLESMKRSLSSAIAAIPAADKDQDKKNQDKTKANADDPAVRLKGLEKEVSSLLSEVNDIRAKNDRAEKFDPSTIDRMESSTAELNTRVEAGLQSTASARTAGAATTSSNNKKKKGKFFGLFGGGDDKYAELTGAPAPGRDRVLFEEAAKEVRKG